MIPENNVIILLSTEALGVTPERNKIVLFGSLAIPEFGTKVR